MNFFFVFSLAQPASHFMKKLFAFYFLLRNFFVCRHENLMPQRASKPRSTRYDVFELESIRGSIFPLKSQRSASLIVPSRQRRQAQITFLMWNFARSTSFDREEEENFEVHQQMPRNFKVAFCSRLAVCRVSTVTKFLTTTTRSFVSNSIDILICRSEQNFN